MANPLIDALESTLKDFSRKLIEDFKTHVSGGTVAGGDNSYGGGFSLKEYGESIDSSRRKLEIFNRELEEFRKKESGSLRGLMKDLDLAQKHITEKNNELQANLDEIFDKNAEAIKSLTSGITESFSSENLNHINKVYENFKNLNEQLKELEKGFVELKAASADTKDIEEEIKKKEEEIKVGEKFIEILEKRLETSKEQLRVDKELAENTGFKGALKIAKNMQDSISEMKSGLQGMYQAVKDFTSPWAKADHAASKYAKTIGLAATGMKSLRASTINNVVKNHIGADFNMGTDELIELQSNYIQGIGRNIRLSDEDQTILAATSAVMGKEGATELATGFENFGIGFIDAGKHATKMFKEASEAGLSFEKYSDNVKKNITIAQNYTFRNGIRGLESMAKKATAIKLDMQMVASFADKVSTVEGALETAAKLQVLGGPFASFADPMGLLNEGLNDMEGLQDRVVNMIQKMGYFDKATGEVKVDAFNKQRIKAMAEATGMDYGSLMTSVNASAKRNEIEAQLKNSSANSLLSDEMKELVKNSGTIVDGKAGVSIKGKFISLDQLNEKEHYNQLVEETRTEAQDIKEIARMLRSITDIEEGNGKQLEAVKSKLVEDSGVGDFQKDIMAAIGKSNGLLAAIVAIQGFNTGLSIFNSFGQFVKGGGSFKSSIKDLFSLRKAHTPVTNSTTLLGGGKAGQATMSASNLGKLGKVGKFKGLVKGSGLVKHLGRNLGAGALMGAAGYFANKQIDKALENGTMTKYGAGHKSSKALATALEGAGMLSFLGPWGMLGGALLGGAYGLHKVNYDRNTEILNTELEKRNLVKKGNYGNRRTKLITMALATGQVNERTLKKLTKKGDIEIIEAIQKKRQELNMGNDERVSENKIDTANFYGVRKLTINGEEVTVSPHKAAVTRLEVASKSSLTANNEKESNNSKPEDINLNINGSLKLTDGYGRSVDIVDTLKKEPNALRSLANLIAKELDKRKDGAYIQRQALLV